MLHIRSWLATLGTSQNCQYLANTNLKHIVLMLRKCVLFQLKCHLNVSALQWRHNDHDGVSNHQPHSCLLNRLLRRRSKKTSKLRVTGLCVGNSPGPVNSPHKGPVTRKMFLFDDVIMQISSWQEVGICGLAPDWPLLELTTDQITDELPGLIQYHISYVLPCICP